MSKLLQKILSASIFPAALIIVSKIVGMMLVNKIFDLSWGIQTQTGSLFSVQVVYESSAKALLCNSYSNLFVVFILILGVSALLFQGTYLHTSHQNPRVLVKLMNFDFLMWLAESDVIFPRLAVWLLFLWAISLMTVVQAVQGDLYPWIAIFGFIASIICTVLSFHDFERDLHTMLPEHGTLKE
jgi:hypothetical protein